MATQIRELLVRVSDTKSKGSDASALATRAAKLVGALEQDLKTHHTLIVSLLVQCAVALPGKIPIYSVIIALFSKAKAEVASDIVAKICASLQDTLKPESLTDDDNALQLRSMVKLLASLATMRVIAAGDVLSLMKQLMETALEFEDVCSSGQKNPKDHALSALVRLQLTADVLAFAAMEALPWVGRVLDDEEADGLEELMTKMDDFMQQRRERSCLFAEWKGMGSEVPENADECVADEGEGMWDAVKNLNRSDTNWTCSAVLGISDDVSGVEPLQMPRVFIMPEPDVDTSNSDAALGRNVAIDVSSAWPFSSVISRRTLVFCAASGAASTGKVLAAHHKVPPADRHVYYMLVRDTLLNFFPAHKAATEQLLQLPLRGRQEPLLVEGLLALVLTAPDARGGRLASQTFRFFVFRVLINLSRVASFPATFVAAVDAFQSAVPFVPAPIRDQFNEWFSFMLSSLNFQWKWDSSISVATAHPDQEARAPRRPWLASLVRAMLPFTYRKRLLELIPAELCKLLPSDDGPKNLFAAGADEEGAEVGGVSEQQRNVYSRLQGMMRAKTHPSAMVVLLRQKKRERSAAVGKSAAKDSAAETQSMDEEVTPAEGDDNAAAAAAVAADDAECRGHEDRCWVLEPTMAAVLQCGVASIAHTGRALDRYAELLEHVIDSSPEVHARAIRAVASFWPEPKQRATGIVLKLVEHRLVSPVAAVGWCFDELKRVWDQSGHIWRLLHDLALLLRGSKVGDAKDFYVAVCSQFYWLASQHLDGDIPQKRSEYAWVRQFFYRLQQFCALHHRSMVPHMKVILVSFAKSEDRVAASVSSCIQKPFSRHW